VRGLGTDLVEISRVEALLRRHGSRFRRRLSGGGAPPGPPVAPGDEAAAVAADWAVREAFLKALGAAAAGVPLSAVSLIAAGNGGGCLRLDGAAARALAAVGGRSVHLAVARAGDRVAALVVID